MRYLIALLALVLCSVASARDCSSLYCEMCYVRYGPVPGYEYDIVINPRSRWGIQIRNVQRATVTQRQIVSAPTQQVVSTTATQLQSMPHAAVDAMLSVVKPRPGQTLYDLGCGDGRILIAAVRDYGCRAVGVEINSETSQLALKNVKAAGLKDMIAMYDGDAREMALTDRADGIADADIVTLYLYSDTIESLIPRLKTLKPGATVISYLHDISGLQTTEEAGFIDGVVHRFFVYRVPVPPPVFSNRFIQKDEVVSAVPTNSKVYLYVGPNCPGCVTAKAGLPTLHSIGIQTHVIEQHNYRTIPTYLIRVGDRSVTRVGAQARESVVRALWALYGVGK